MMAKGMSFLYLDAYKDKQVINIGTMAHDLQESYNRDYGRKKKNAFKISVERAYDSVLASMKLKAGKAPGSYSKLEQQHLDNKKSQDIGSSDYISSDENSEASFSSDNEEYVLHKETNSMNSFLTNMYKKPASGPSGQTNAPSIQKRENPYSSVENPVYLIDRKGGSKLPEKTSTLLAVKNVVSNSPTSSKIDDVIDISDTEEMAFSDASSHSAYKRKITAPSGGGSQSSAPSGGHSQTSAPSGGRSQSSAPSGARSLTSASSGVRSLTTAPSGGRSLTSAPSGGRSQTSAPSGGRSQTSASSGGRSLTSAPSGGRSLTSAPSGGRSLTSAPSGSRSQTSAPSGGRSQTSAQSGGHSLSSAPSGGRSQSLAPSGGGPQSKKDEEPPGKKTNQTEDGRPPKKQKTLESRKDKKGTEVVVSDVTFADIGGNDKTLKEVCKLLVHMKHPEVYQRLGVTPPRGFLLHGPPGCGKTLLAHAIAGELELPFIKIAATEVVSGVSGESEEKLRDIFQMAISCAPCVLFLDEIDSITPKRETASKDMERRIVSQLLSCMDDLNSKSVGHVLVIGATNRPDSLDPALRRAGRFDREISLGIPDEDARKRILMVLCKDLRLAPEFDFHHLARNTPGFVGADLMALAGEAAIVAVNRVFQDLQVVLKSQGSPTDGAASEELSVIEEVVHCVSEPTGDALPKLLVNTETALDKSPGSPTEGAENKEQPEEGAENKEQPEEVGRDGEPTVPEIDTSVETVQNKVLPTLSTVSECPPVLSLEESGMKDTMNTVKQHHQPKKIDVSSSDAELKSVLSWLKEFPPLTEKQLDSLFISMADFTEALNHVQPSAKREGFATIPDVTWEDIGALKAVREELQMAILAPVRYPEQFLALGLTSPPGVLLSGPPGCGKTLLAKAVANESGINFISVKGPELLNMYVGESERAVRQVFQRARNSSPCVIFFDELDALCPRRSHSGEGGASVRVVNQLLTEMDGLESRKQVFIMGATNRPDIIDPAILRPGRLDKILYVGLPTVEDRLDILKTITKHGTKPLLSEDVDLENVANDPKCQGFTGADLAALVREAAVASLRGFMSQPQASSIPSTGVKMSHFEHAFQKVLPSVTAKDRLMYEKTRGRTT